MTKAKQFHRKEKQFTEEDKIRRRAIVFGLLTVFLAVVLLIWGIPLFVNLVTFLGDVRTENIELVETSIPPPVPRFSYIPEATNSAQIEISGVTASNSIVKIRFNNEIIETQAGEEGEFKLEKLSLKSGSNEVSAWAVNEDGNQSDETATFEIIYDTQPPEVEIITPEEGAELEEQTVEIEGKTEPNARALVNDHVAIIDQDGVFKYNFILQEGENDIIIRVEDRAGNKTEKTLTVTYLP